jgi:GntR family transcriptional regulator, transcriptional repressor for pyruvate dehydrogenase complex
MGTDIHQHSAAQRAVLAIQDLIREATFAAGAQLPPQRELCIRLGVSRTSLREALSTLEALGFVRTRPGQGTFVLKRGEGVPPPPVAKWRFSSQYEMQEVYEFRYLIETAAVRLAAVNISDVELTALRTIHEQLKIANQSLDLVEATSLDFDFHLGIATASKNRMFIDLFQSFRKIFEESIMLPNSRHEQRWETVVEHTKILDSLNRRDPDGAAYYLQLHLTRATERIGVRLHQVF